MIMRRPPSEHDEWLEQNGEQEKKPIPHSKKDVRRLELNQPRGAKKRFKALNDDIQEFG